MAERDRIERYAFRHLRFSKPLEEPTSAHSKLDARQGLEPWSPTPKAGVLPLDDQAVIMSEG